MIAMLKTNTSSPNNNIGTVDPFEVSRARRPVMYTRVNIPMLPPIAIQNAVM